MDTPDHILVVDDDREIRRLLGEYLEKNGLRVSTAADGAGMWRALESRQIDLVVLDLMLPGDDGLLLCRTLRGKPALADLPVIMLTARGDETDRIVGLEMGADDYLAKPFSARELLARIKVILRRARSLPPNLRRDDAPDQVRFSGWTLDNIERHLRAADGTLVPLSGAEYRLLRLFIDHAHRVLSRDQLMELMHGRDAEPFARSIDVQVSRLRQRLRDDPREPRLIKTVRGEGYVFTATVGDRSEP